MLFTSVCDLSNLYVLQRNNSPWLLVCRKLKVVKAIIIEDKPSSFPAFVSAPLLP